MSPPFAFGISEFTTMPWSFDGDVERYARLGLDATEVVEAKLDPERMDEQRNDGRLGGLGYPPHRQAERMTPTMEHPSIIPAARAVLVTPPATRSGGVRVDMSFAVERTDDVALDGRDDLRASNLPGPFA